MLKHLRTFFAVLLPSLLCSLPAQANSKTTPTMIACLGDSTTLGGTGAEQTPWPQLLTLNLSTGRACANQGKSGATVADASSRYTVNIKSQGFYGVVLMIGINDIEVGTSGATVLTAVTSLVNTMLADGLKVLIFTVTPSGLFTGWTGAKQTELDNLNTGILALTGTGLTKLDVRPFVWDPAAHNNLLAANSIGDGRHLSQTGIVALESGIRSAVSAL